DAPLRAEPHRGSKRFAAAVEVEPRRCLAVGADLVVRTPETLDLGDRVADAHTGKALPRRQDAVRREPRLIGAMRAGCTLADGDADERDNEDCEDVLHRRGAQRSVAHDTHPYRRSIVKTQTKRSGA